MPDAAIGALLGATLLGDAVISLWLTTHADRIGRRRVLAAGALLMCAAAAVFAGSTWPPVLFIAGIVGVISPSGGDVGPFLSVEQAMLAQVTPGSTRTRAFARFNVVGRSSGAVGALVGGLLAGAIIGQGFAPADAYRIVIVVYGLGGFALAALSWALSPSVEVQSAPDVSISRRLGLHKSRGIVGRLTMLMGIDAFGSGFIVNSLLAYWFQLRFGADVQLIGLILFASGVLAAVSALGAPWLAARIGLIRTMVYTQIPANSLLVLVPLMPTLPLAIILWLIRCSISQMDIPARQSFTMSVVAPDERSAAAGFTGIALTVGASFSPIFSAPLIGSVALAGVPFVVAGSLKLVYDGLLFRAFRHLRPLEGDDPE
jgi:predicted MFS family arabinose efflux permease